MFDFLKKFVARFTAEVGEETARQVDQTRSELAATLFTGNAFVMYGPSQYTPEVSSPDQELNAEHQHEMCMER